MTLDENPKPQRTSEVHQWAAEFKFPFQEILEVQLVGHTESDITFEMTVKEKHLRTLGIMHGGVTASLLDTALGFAAGLKAPDNHFVVTVQLNVNYIRPAWQGEKLISRGELQHSGNQTAVARGELRTAEGTLVASASGTFMFVPLPESAKEQFIKKHKESN